MLISINFAPQGKLLNQQHIVESEDKKESSPTSLLTALSIKEDLDETSSCTIEILPKVVELAKKLVKIGF